MAVLEEYCSPITWNHFAVTKKMAKITRKGSTEEKWRKLTEIMENGRNSEILKQRMKLQLRGEPAEMSRRQ